MIRLVALAAAVVFLGGCDSKPAQQSDPSSSPATAVVPPPLVPAMPLPDNAVDNAVAKLDGVVAELMK
jgi:hypothetical protein